MKLDLKVDEKRLADHIKTNPKELAYILQLYFEYNKLLKLTNDSRNREEKLNKLEDSIYTVNGKVLNDVQRIDFELNNILGIISQQKEKNINIKNDIENLTSFFSSRENMNDLEIEYIKKQISIIQSKMGIKNTFFNSVYKAFLEIYNNIYISSINTEGIEGHSLEKKGKMVK